MHTTPPSKVADLYAIRDAMPGNVTQAQCERLREALSRYSITTFEAMRYLDVYDPRARMTQLRRSGLHILTTWVRMPTECGALHRVELYTLVTTA